MKTTLFLITILFTMSLNAQWYANQYNVTDMNDLSQDQLEMSFDQAAKLTQAGQIITGISAVVAIIGTSMYSKGLDDIVTSTSYSQIDQGVSKGTNGAVLMYAGYLGVGTGIGLWIAGEQRKNAISIHMMKYNTSYIPSIGLKVTF